MNGDTLRLAEGLLGVTKAIEPLPHAERAEVLRAACIMYDVPVAKLAPTRRKRGR